MSDVATTVSAFMTPDPCAVDEDLTLADAADRMRANNIRHLLVLHGDELIGVVSSGDLALAQSVSNAEAPEIHVRSAARPVRTCLPDCPLSAVALDMEAHHLDCVVVVDADGTAVGIFTIVDALQALRTALAGHPVTPQIVPTHRPDSGPTIADTQMRVRVKRLLRRDGAAPRNSDGMAFGRGVGL